MNRRYNRYGLVRANHALHERGAFVLVQRVYKGCVPDGDGWREVWEEGQWNGKHNNPLSLTMKAADARKQAAARMVRKVETADDRHLWLWDVEGDEYRYMGRNEGEVRPNTSVQGYRGTDFEKGSTYAGGLKAIKDALKKRKQYDEQPVQKKSAEEERLEAIAALERKIEVLMGLAKETGR